MISDCEGQWSTAINFCLKFEWPAFEICYKYTAHTIGNNSAMKAEEFQQELPSSPAVLHEMIEINCWMIKERL